jgi:hypothetical protein
MDKRLIGQQRDYDGLCLLDQFGWIRAKELANMLWPNSKRPKVNASELVGKWMRAGWILTRHLPDNAGHALVLSAAGAVHLRQLGYPGAATGKDWGETHGSDWSPPKTWRHELLAMGVLAHLYVQGWTIIPERQLRRDNQPVQFPDGLARRGDCILWIEVENSRKSGAHLRNMVTGLTLASQARAEPLSGWVANRAFVAFVADAEDERGYRLDHRNRVVAALSARSSIDVPLMLASLTSNAAGGISTVAIEEITVDSRKVTERLASIVWLSSIESPDFDAYEYFLQDGLEYRCGYGLAGWWWSVSQEGQEIASADVPTIDMARRALVAQLHYREWSR